MDVGKACANALTDVLRSSKKWPVYFEGDSIWGFQLHSARPTAIRIASLSGTLTSTLKGMLQGQIKEALSNIDTISDMEFCLCQLMPYLRFLATGHSEDLECPAELQKTISSLVQEVKILNSQIREQPISENVASRFRNLLGVPCAVFAGVLIPMYMTRPLEMQSDVRINGINYRYSPEKVRQLDTVLSGIERELQNAFAQVNSIPPEKINAVKRCFESAESVLMNYCQLVQKGVYQIIYKDNKYELHYSGGKFMLVIGPLQNRINPSEFVCIGIPVSVRSLSSHFVMPPLRANSPERLWVSPGLPMGPNMCIGQGLQYARLMEPSRTCVEVLLDWLDVGVNLATYRTAFHEQWRSLRNSLPFLKSNQIPRGPDETR